MHIARVLCALTLPLSLGAPHAAPQPPLPEGAGREPLLRACTQCHGLDLVLRQPRTRQQWEVQMEKMLAKGAQLSDPEFDAVAEYLGAHFSGVAETH